MDERIEAAKNIEMQIEDALWSLELHKKIDKALEIEKNNNTMNIRLRVKKVPANR